MNKFLVLILLLVFYPICIFYLFQPNFNYQNSSQKVKIFVLVNNNSAASTFFNISLFLYSTEHKKRH